MQYTLFLNGYYSPADRARELFKSDLNEERIVFSAKKKTFHRVISAFLAVFAKAQVVSTCFDRFLKTIHDASSGSAKIGAKHWRQTVGDLNAV